jgi:DNA-binding LacI/PurR family transcriptional regulator/signal transduction histidine kinase
MQHKNQDNQSAGRKRPTIGLFVENASDVDQGYHPSILNGVHAAAEAQDANLFCFVGGALYGVPGVQFDSQRNILYQIASPDHLDGLAIISAIGNFRDEEELQDLNSRYRPSSTVGIGAPIKGSLNVTVDHKKGMVDLLTHLIETHHYRRIAFIAGPEESPDAQLRYQVYRDMLAHYDIPFDPALVAPGLFRFSSGAEAVQLLLDERQVNFEVIVAANDHMAIGAMEGLQARGIIVPYDVAVVGFDDIKQASNIMPPMTTVKQPLHQMGEEAVNILLAKMADEGSPEQIVLPTELVIRRSCGCFWPDEPAISPPAQDDGGAAGASPLLAHREAIVADLVQAVDFSGLNGRETAHKLLDSFFDEVMNEANGRFLSTVDRFLRLVKGAGGDIASWQALVAILRRYFLAGAVRDALSWRVGALLNDAQSFIGEEMRTADAQGYRQTESQNWLLHVIGQSLITMFDLEGLMETITKSIPRLGIPGCYLVLYDPARLYQYPQPPPPWSRLVMACNEHGRIPLPPDGHRFLTSQLLPKKILPTDRRYTMMVEPLYFREEQIGFVMLERGPKEGIVYELLRGQLSSALKGALLLQAHEQAEKELRQHRDHLDELIQERTAALAAANEQLRQEVDERRLAVQELQESQKNLAYAQMVAQLGYYYWDLLTGVIFWSDEMYHLFGVDKATFVPAADTFGQFLHPDDLYILSDENFDRTIRQKSHQMEFRIIDHRTGALKYLYLWGETTFDDQGRPKNNFGIIQDVTVRRQAELKLEAYTAELERSNRELQEFAYVASHDLQEPLRKIQTFGNRLQEKYDPVLDERGHDYLERMQNAAGRMQALIVDLLSFSRVRTHGQPFSKVELSQIVMQVLQDLEIMVAEVKAELIVADLPEVEADALQMKQLFQNLLSNALKFHRPDVPLQIKVYSRRVDSFYEISVSDNGIGFEEKYSERIFNVFERLHNREEYPGTGVGLAICRRIAERHGGYIRAHSQPGAGATFIVGLPA